MQIRSLRHWLETRPYNLHNNLRLKPWRVVGGLDSRKGYLADSTAQVSISVLSLFRMRMSMRTRELENCLFLLLPHPASFPFHMLWSSMSTPVGLKGKVGIWGWNQEAECKRTISLDNVCASFVLGPFEACCSPQCCCSPGSLSGLTAWTQQKHVCFCCGNALYHCHQNHYQINASEIFSGNVPVKNYRINY